MQEETVQPQKSLEELLAEAQAKIEQQRDTMMRAVADAENARKRAQAEAVSARKYALESFAEGLLPVIDSLEAAVADRRYQWRRAHAQAAALGAREIEHPRDRPPAGERFDPHRHQAMAAVEAER